MQLSGRSFIQLQAINAVKAKVRKKCIAFILIRSRKKISSIPLS